MPSPQLAADGISFGRHILNRLTERTTTMGLVALALPHLSPALAGETAMLVTTAAGFLLTLIPDPAPAPSPVEQLAQAMADAIVAKLPVPQALESAAAQQVAP